MLENDLFLLQKPYEVNTYLSMEYSAFKVYQQQKKITFFFTKRLSLMKLDSQRCE